LKQVNRRDAGGWGNEWCVPAFIRNASDDKFNFMSFV